MSLRSRNLDIRQWEDVLLDALHSVRSLLCTGTNATPHERMFRYNRKATVGTALPSWLINSRRALLKRVSRASKYDPFVEEVELLDCNPTYARIRRSGGQEDTVSVRHLAPLPSDCALEHNPTDVTPPQCTSSEMPEDPSPRTVPSESLDPRLTPELIEANESLQKMLEQQQRVHPYCLRNREA